jgi:hypothetical protein
MLDGRKEISGFLFYIIVMIRKCFSLRDFLQTKASAIS